jgi:DNA-binding MarR family transcriptional regulator
VPKIDLTKPLPPEPLPNVSVLMEGPYKAIDRPIFILLAERGHPLIRPAHSKVFEVIKGTGSRVTDMADAAAMTKQAMQYLVDDLEQLGYAERIPDPDDRRAKLIRLTPRGRECVLIARESMAATEAAWAKRLGAGKMEQLRALLAELNAVIGQDHGRGN